MLNHEGRKATRAELEALADAAQEHFRDTGSIPASVAALESDAGLAGWAGPYMTGAVPDAATGVSQWVVDAWSRNYTFTVGTTLTITSRGPDGSSGTSDDLSVVVDFTVVRREETLRELTILNLAITLYNATWLVTDPLSTDWGTARNQLVTRGYLPADTDLATDEWGLAYSADPAGMTPVVRVRSSSL
jgi:hypothetical protein